jgi:hypothetical protein
LVQIRKFNPERAKKGTRDFNRSKKVILSDYGKTLRPSDCLRESSISRLSKITCTAYMYAMGKLLTKVPFLKRDPAVDIENICPRNVREICRVVGVWTFSHLLSKEGN